MRDYDFGNHYQFKGFVGLPWSKGFWQNQLLSCSSCNTWRGDHPNVEDGLRLLLENDVQRFDIICMALRNTGTLTEDQISALYNAAAGTLIWPDTSVDIDGMELSIGEPTSSLLTFEYSEQTPRTLSTRNLVRLDPAALAEPWVDVAALRLWVVPNTNFIQGLPNAAQVAKRVELTILAHNLNFRNPSDLLAADTRVDQRTIAYTTARGLWDHTLTGYVHTLVTQFQVTDPELIIEHPWIQLNLRSFSAQIQRMGFWSAWAFSLAESFQKAPWSTLPAEVLKNLSYDVLIQNDPRPPDGPPPDAPEPVMVLPGTDVHRLPWV